MDAADAATGREIAPDPRRWLALAVIAVVQLMIVIDGTVVNVALPTAQHDLGFSDADRQWVLTAYAVAFGGLLLLGGRVADYVGRRRVLVIGLIGFAAASLAAGLADAPWMLFAARAAQGVFAAAIAPSALSTLAVTFTDPRERAKAFGIFGAAAGGGQALGLLLGGVLTEFLSWRWTLLINVPLGLLAALATLAVVRPSRLLGRPRYDIGGAITVTGGLVALVLGATNAATFGWAAAETIIPLALAALLLVAFFLIQARSSHPLLPLRVLTERNRAGVFITSLVIGAVLYALFLFLTYYLQGTLGYSALQTGLAFLPLSVLIAVSAPLSGRLISRFSPRAIFGGGLLLTLAGMVLLTQIGVDSNYATAVLPAQILMGIGLGPVFVQISSVGLHGITPADTGVASGALNTAQQGGGALGVAVLNTIAASSAAAYLTTHGLEEASATVHGYTVVFWVAAGLIAVALAVTTIMINARPAGSSAPSRADTETDTAGSHA